jgi:transcriptional regulator
VYLPPAFAETRTEVLLDAIRAHPLALLVTVAVGRPEASHVPLVHDRGAGAHGRLLGHLAKANPQARTLPDGEALAVFTGPAAYVTPSWYASKREHGKVVPTWNYVTIHARGRLRLIGDPDELRALVVRLTRRMEHDRPEPWAVDDAPEPFVRAQLKGIVGLELTLTGLTGKWKLSQNKPPADRAGAAAGLAAETDAGARAVARLMGERHEPASDPA